MDVSNVSHEDGMRAAQLANFLKDGRWSMSAEQAATFAAVVVWYNKLCTQMAAKLPAGKETKAEGAPGPGQFKVKGITPGKPETKPAPKGKK